MFALLITAISFAVIFEIGVSQGKKRLIEAERKAAQQNHVQGRSIMPVSGGKSLPEEPSERREGVETPTKRTESATKTEESAEVKPTRRDTQVPTGGELPIEPPQDQPIERSQTVQYTVQVGTFGSRQNAEKLVALLKSYEYKSWLRVETAASGTLYSVFVGGFNTREKAKKFGGLLQNRLSFVTSYMVREIQE